MPKPAESHIPLHAEGFMVGDLIGKLREEFEKLQKEKCPDRPGGYFCFADGATGQIYVIARLGDPASAKAEKYMSLCQEKAFRLSQHDRHASSWQSRDEDLDRFGGAIRGHAQRMSGVFQPVILSFSGLTEACDEELMIALGLRLGMLHRFQAEAIAELHSIAELRSAAKQMATI
jgi:hypothetical protein